VNKPVLWQIPVSHYNEKARWALAYKAVEHERRAPPPPSHMAVSLVLTRGKHKTFPLLQLDGEAIGDSSEIIEALERRFPDPPLYPADPAERRRALELEDWFDEELGPHIRLLAWHELTRDPERFAQFVVAASPVPVPEPVRPILVAGERAFVNVRFGVKSEEAAEEARRRVVAALDKLEGELNGSDYLVGGRFSVADLTAAALLYPLVLPPEGPRQPSDPPPAFERFRAPLRERRGFCWVEEMFRRHRKTAGAMA
jgi:glutathione S-transferase